MDEVKEAKSISKNDYLNNNLNINNKNITIKNVGINQNNIEINNDLEEDYSLWVSINNNHIGNKLNTYLEDYKTRTDLIDMIVNKSIQNNVNGVILDIGQVSNIEVIKRFLIEMTPKLREVGISTGIVLNDGITKDDYKNIVDYVIE